MAGRRTDVIDVRELLRRIRLGQSGRQIAADLGLAQKTIRKYRLVAAEEGWLERPELPGPAEIDARLAARVPAPPPRPPNPLEALRPVILELRAKGVEMVALWQILRDCHGFTGSYSTVRRFVLRLEPKDPAVCVRVETPAGEEAQVDFGSAGEVVDPATGQLRRAWMFVMTLGFSRHQYAEIVFDQKVSTFLALHVRAFEFFGGVLKRIVIDNLKAGITRACFHDPQVQRSYRELAEHYGFTISPCRVRTPRHKGKVESGVRYVRRNALAGRTFRDAAEANAHLIQWILGTAGTREHGTTHEAPLARFAVERGALQSLPEARYEPAVWKLAKLHPDCHIVFEKSCYSAPHRLVGRTLLVRATAQRLEIFHEHELVATHPRAVRAGQRISSDLHYPPEKLAGLRPSAVRLQAEAQAVGPSTSRLVGDLLDEKPVDRLRAAMGVMALVKRYGPARVEAACRRALVFEPASYRAVVSILKKGLENAPLPPEAVAAGPVPKTHQFARPVRDIAAGL